MKTTMKLSVAIALALCCGCSSPPPPKAPSKGRVTPQEVDPFASGGYHGRIHLPPPQSYGVADRNGVGNGVTQEPDITVWVHIEE